MDIPKHNNIFHSQKEHLANDNVIAQSRNVVKVHNASVNQLNQLLNGQQPTLFHNALLIDDAYENKIQSAGFLQKRQAKLGSLSHKNSKLEIVSTPQIHGLYFPELSIAQDKRSSISMKSRPLPIEKKNENRSVRHQEYGIRMEKTQHENGSTRVKAPPRLPALKQNEVQPVQKKEILSPSKKKNSTHEIIANRVEKFSRSPQPDMPTQVLNTSTNQSKFLKISSISQKGQSSQYKKLVNQDVLVIKKRLQNIDNLYLLAVADGHGNNGHFVTRHVKKFLPQLLEFEDKRIAKSRLKSKNVESIFQLDLSIDLKLFTELVTILLSKVFVGINKQLEAQKNFDISLSGSTLVVAIINEQLAVLANCGDSRCILFNDKGQLIFETSDHKPEKPEEKQRIESQYKGRVRRQRYHNTLTKEVEELEGPYRVWSQLVDLPGLAMSRSIGDGMAKSLGVIADPEINIIDMKDKQVFGVALASDGIWDAYASEELALALTDYLKAQSIRETVVKVLQDTHQRWLDMTQNKIECKGGKGRSTLDIDDITLVVGIVNHNQ